MNSLKRTPTILEREPLVDALFEVRLDETAPIADILPGILYNKLDPKPRMRRLPGADIPLPMRSNDPNLKYIPIQGLEWGEYIIAIGDHNVVISCKLPYPKWPNFRAAILQIVKLIGEAELSASVSRFSVKYVNLIEANDLAAQIKKIDLAIRVGSLEVASDHFDLKVQHVDQDILHIISVITGASADMPGGKNATGVVVDIDSIRNIEPISFQDFSKGLEPELEVLRQSNKIRFFDCLKDDAVKEMGPVYE
ncbi:MAG: TIGR04255 family protein [Limimaricola soesokkakensis]|uniref:TIGR04255 family protein n=1 Tax=Limimaricola soesokkakensis TaxID=1343159 RepID=UPI004059329E